VGAIRIPIFPSDTQSRSLSFARFIIFLQASGDLEANKVELVPIVRRLLQGTKSFLDSAVRAQEKFKTLNGALSLPNSRPDFRRRNSSFSYAAPSRVTQQVFSLYLRLLFAVAFEHFEFVIATTKGRVMVVKRPLMSSSSASASASSGAGQAAANSSPRRAQ
jgi:hypothetical protein